jgi:hypothetical protein
MFTSTLLLFILFIFGDRLTVTSELFIILPLPVEGGAIMGLSHKLVYIQKLALVHQVFKVSCL